LGDRTGAQNARTEGRQDAFKHNIAAGIVGPNLTFAFL